MKKKEISTVFILSFFVISSLFMWWKAGYFMKYPFALMSFDHGFLLPVLWQIFFIACVLAILGLIALLNVPTLYSRITYIFAGALGFLFLPVNIPVFITVLGFVIATSLFDSSIRKNIKNYIKIDLLKIFHVPLGGLFFYVTIFLSITFYQVVAINADLYKFSMPHDFSQQFIKMLVQSSPELMEEENMKDKDGKKITEEMFYNIAQKQLEDQMNNLIDEYRLYLPAFVTFVFLTALGFLKFLAVYMAIGLIYVIFSFLKGWNIISVERVEMEVERVKIGSGESVTRG